MKLCMISLGDMHDPRTWSGTVQAVTQRFEDHGLISIRSFAMRLSAR